MQQRESFLSVMSLQAGGTCLNDQEARAKKAWAQLWQYLSSFPSTVQKPGCAVEFPDLHLKRDVQTGRTRRCRKREANECVTPAKGAEVECILLRKSLLKRDEWRRMKTNWLGAFVIQFNIWIQSDPTVPQVLLFFRNESIKLHLLSPFNVLELNHPSPSQRYRLPSPVTAIKEFSDRKPQ